MFRNTTFSPLTIRHSILRLVGTHYILDEQNLLHGDKNTNTLK